MASRCIRNSDANGSDADDDDNDVSMTASAANVDNTSADDESDEAEWNGFDDSQDDEDGNASVETANDDDDDDDSSNSDSTADMEVSVNDDDNDGDFEAGGSSKSTRRPRLSTRPSRVTSIASFFSRDSSSGTGGKKRKERSDRNEQLRNRRRKIADVLPDQALDASTRHAREAESKRQATGINFANLDDSDDAAGNETSSEPLVCLNVMADGSVPTGAPNTTDAPVFVHTSVSRRLKKHQVAGTRFLWSHVAVEPNGFGCVLADYMGLGKTLQVLTVVEAFLSLKRMNRDGLAVDRHRHVLILAPTICVRNWEAEVVKWFGKKEARRLVLTTLESAREKKMTDRCRVVQSWHRRGGLLIMGYELYRLLVLQSSGDEKIAPTNQKYARAIRDVYTCLANPGPDLIVLDEGHRVRDHKSKLVKALGHVKTARRIILTGYPLQNHLEEYWTMVNFARPDYLGSLEEFKNRFVDPIKNGQCLDSSESDLRLARQRAYVLTRELKPLVLRRDQQFLYQQLPPKKEWVLICRLTDQQEKLYRAFLESGVPTRGGGGSGPGATVPELLALGGTGPGAGKVDVLGGYHISMAIANHPDVLCESFHALERELRSDPRKVGSSGGRRRRPSIDDFIVDDDDYDEDEDVVVRNPARGRAMPPADIEPADDSDVDTLLAALDVPAGATTGNRTARPLIDAPPTHRLTFAAPFVQTYAPSRPDASGKMLILLALLAECRAVGDRVIVFSQSIATLNTIEKLLAQTNAHTRRRDDRLAHLRIDGSTPQNERFHMISQFNDPDEDVDAILISTKAGGEGINLCAGNRIVLFDVCWNPCNDAQSMCRCYRFGQLKPVFVYRFVTAGTMEKKVYDLQIRKEGVAKRIVDDRTTERRFKTTDLAKYFSLDDFEHAVAQQQTTGLRSSSQRTDDASEAAKSPRPDTSSDAVLERVLAKFQSLGLGDSDATTSLDTPPCETNTVDEAITNTVETQANTVAATTLTYGGGGGGWIVDWFEQETMFEEDLDQQCSPTEAAEIMESHVYNKSLQRLRKAGSHLISRDGLLFAACSHCRVNNEVYPEATTGVPVPKNLECTYCRRAVPTAGATAAPVVPQLPVGMQRTFPGMMLPGGIGGVMRSGGGSAALPSSVVMDAGSSWPSGLPGQSQVPSGSDLRVLPPYLASISNQQRPPTGATGPTHPALTDWDRYAALQAKQRALEQAQAEQRAIERQTLELRDRCLLVLRRGMAGCQALKRAAQDCGATIAIEVTAQTTDIVSAMSRIETLAFLKRSKLPSDVELRDDAWLRREIAKAQRGDSGAVDGADGDGDSSETPAQQQPPVTAAAEAGESTVSSPTTASTTIREASGLPAAPAAITADDMSSDTIELLDSDNEGDAVAPVWPAPTVRSIAPAADDYDDDDVIEIL